jgi:hypothetical protein
MKLGQVRLTKKSNDMTYGLQSGCPSLRSRKIKLLNSELPDHDDAME